MLMDEQIRNYQLPEPNGINLKNDTEHQNKLNSYSVISSDTSGGGGEGEYESSL